MKNKFKDSTAAARLNIHTIIYNEVKSRHASLIFFFNFAKEIKKRA